MNKLGNFLREADLFSSQVGLQINNSFFYKTKFGGFTSILAIVLIIIFIWPRVSSFYTKDEVKVVTNRIYSPNPPESSLNPDRFMFALRVYQSKRDFITNPYFNITVQQGVYTLEGSQQRRKFYDIQLEPCTSNHWEKMKSYANFTQLFESYGDDYLCPTVVPCVTPNNPSLKWNPICAPQSEVDQVTQRDGFHGMNIYHSNYVLNVDQPHNFFTPFINDKLYYTFVPYKMAKLCDIYFQDIDVVNDMSLLPTTDNRNYKFLTQENNDILETTQLSRQDGVFVVLTLRLSPYVTSINRSYQKLTQFLAELGGLAQLVFVCAGLILKKYNNFRFILDLANTLYTFESKSQKETRNNAISYIDSPNKQDTNIAISPYLQLQRSLFQQNIQSDQNIQVYNNSFTKVNEINNNFIQNNNQNLQLSSNLFSQNKLFSQTQIGEFKVPKSTAGSKPKSNNQKSKEKENEQVMKTENGQEQDQEKEKQKQSGKAYLIKQFKKILQQKQNFQIGFQYIISKITINKFFKTEYNQYINKATKMINNDLDIYNILEKIQQIDKIKNIIFDQYQRLIFQYHPKPVITLEPKENFELQKEKYKSVFLPENGILLEKLEFQTVEQFEKLFDSYQMIKQNQEYTIHDKNINNRLIRQIGSDLLHIFQVSENLDIVDTSKYKTFCQINNSFDLDKSKYFKSQVLQLKSNKSKKQLSQLNIIEDKKNNFNQQSTEKLKPRMSVYFEDEQKHLDGQINGSNFEKEQKDFIIEQINIYEQKSNGIIVDQIILDDSNLSSFKVVPDENEKGGMDRYKVIKYARSHSDAN